MSKRPPGQKPHICQSCGKTFWEYPYRNRKFCSMLCRDASKERAVEISCLECGSTFWDHLSQNRKYCSRACKDPFNNVRIEGSVAYIELTTSSRQFVAETLVDVEDVERIRSWQCRLYPSWSKAVRSYYVMLHKGERQYLLHRLLLNSPADVHVDHVEPRPDSLGFGGTLDNRKINLRRVSQAENNQNKSGARQGSYSGVRNVYPNHRDGNWIVKLMVAGRSITVGRYDTLDEAEEAAIAARQRHFTHSTH